MNRIKVAYFIGSLGYGGAETQLLELLKHLDRTRIEPSLILLDCAGGARAASLVESVVDLRVPQRNKKLRSFGDVTRAAAATLRLAAYLVRTRPDIVHAILPEAHAVAAAAVTMSRRGKLIGSRRSLASAYRRTASLTLVDKVATRWSDLMVGNSDAVAHELNRMDGVPRERVFRIYNGTDIDRFRPGNLGVRYNAGWKEENVVFGMVANFRASKRHIDFILAAEIIAHSVPEARFVLAGQDCEGLVGSLKDEIRMRGLEPVFTFFPLLTKPETLYPSLDVFLCTSETEGLSNVLLEAGSCGLPIVATNVGGNPEVVRNGFNGIIVEPKKPGQVAAAALQLAASRTVREEMGKRSREWVSSQFSINAMVRAHMALYEGLARPAYCAGRDTAVSEGLRVQ
jgi:glycosyltransferase involved in cell wall biosynthesis